MISNFRVTNSIVHRLGGCFFREEEFGGILYNPQNDEFYLSDHEGVAWLYRSSRSGLDIALELACRSLSACCQQEHYIPGPKFIGRWTTGEMSIPGSPELIPVSPRLPLLFNWLVTAHCPFRCKYCFAQDVMRCSPHPISEETVAQICAAVLNTDALAIVLTGGEPLTSPHIEHIIGQLSQRKGLIIDTSGYGIEDLIPILQGANAHVRVSLDSVQPNDNDRWRVSKNKRTSAIDTALRAIDLCVKNHVHVSVQTVLTSGNHRTRDLEAMHDHLLRRGVCKWTLHLMVTAGALRAGIAHAVESRSRIVPHRDAVLANVGKLMRTNAEHLRRGEMGLEIRLIDSRDPNSVLLITPQGELVTEAPDGSGKIHVAQQLTDPDVFSVANRSAHAYRYLGYVPGTTSGVRISTDK